MVIREQLIILLLLVWASIAGAQEMDCKDDKFLERYTAIGATEWAADGNGLVLNLTADLHSADCGSPDCFGTKIRLELALDRDEGRCGIAEATMRTEGFASERFGEVPVEDIKAGPVSVEPENADLQDQGLSQWVFREKPEGRALMLTPEIMFYYEHVGPDDELKPGVDPGELEDDGCCWGASSAVMLHYAVYLASDGQVEAIDKDESG